MDVLTGLNFDRLTPQYAKHAGGSLLIRYISEPNRLFEPCSIPAVLAIIPKIDEYFFPNYIPCTLSY